MKWVNHKINTFSIVFFLTNNFWGALFAMAGSIFPDWIEGNNYESEKWKRKHRMESHLLIVYLIMAFAVFFIAKLQFQHNVLTPLKFSSINIHSLLTSGFNRIHLPEVHLTAVINPLLTIFFFYLIGCCFHILEDAICGKVPILSTRKRVGIKLFKVGSKKEYLFTITLFLTLLFLKFSV